MAEASGARRLPTKQWLYKQFLVRFPEIKMVTPKKRDRARDDLSDETIDRYFSLLETTLDDLKIKRTFPSTAGMLMRQGYPLTILLQRS